LKHQPTTSRQVIAAFDEPDTHLDYISQRKIFDIIKRISVKEGLNVIVSTHSLNLIDRIPLTDVIHFVLGSNGRTALNILKTEDQQLLDLFMYQISDSMGLRNSVMLNERCFLIIEGLTEITSLPILFQVKYKFSPQAGGIRILNGEGGMGARAFAKFLNQNKRNVIFMVDTDTQTSPKSRNFTSASLVSDGFDVNRQVHFVGNVEYEDAFSDEIYLRTAQSSWPKADGTSWRLQEFQDLRGSADFADALLALIRNQTRKMITKPEVGYFVAKSITEVSEIPGTIMSALEHAYNLANADTISQSEIPATTLTVTEIVP